MALLPNLIRKELLRYDALDPVDIVLIFGRKKVYMFIGRCKRGHAGGSKSKISLGPGNSGNLFRGFIYSIHIFYCQAAKL